MKYIYGPVKSRRLGLSLGISPIPHKTCNFDCIYCQLGKTIEKTSQRKEYFLIEEIVAELQGWLKKNIAQARELRFITLAGMGEPILNTRIGDLIAQIKAITKVPVAVITNASLLFNPEIRKAVILADLIVPSLDAIEEDVFLRINRPDPGVDLGRIIQGLVDLRKEFSGQIWLEVMLVKDVNDSLEHIRKLRDIVSRINPDKLQLNLPVRSTAMDGISAPDFERLELIKEVLGTQCEVV